MENNFQKKKKIENRKILYHVNFFDNSSYVELTDLSKKRLPLNVTP